MEDLLKILILFKDPALMISIIALAVMVWVNIQMFKILQRRDAVIESLATEISEVNVTVGRLIELMNVLVYGRKKEGE